MSFRRFMGREPCALEGLCSCGTSGGIGIEDGTYEVFGYARLSVRLCAGHFEHTFLRDIFPITIMVLDFSLGDFLQENLGVTSSERPVSAEQNVSDDACCPDIHRLAMAVLGQHLGRDIRQAPGNRVQLLVRREEVLGAALLLSAFST